MDHLIIILIGFVLAISLARIIIPNIIIISRRKGLFDLPDGRKVHRRPISRLGGVCFFPTILFAVTFLVALCKKAGWFFWMDGTTQFPELLLLCSGLTLLFIVGIADDLVGVRWRQKFLVQIFAAAMFPLVIQSFSLYYYRCVTSFLLLQCIWSGRAWQKDIHGRYRQFDFRFYSQFSDN